MQQKKIVIEISSQTLTTYIKDKKITSFRCVTGDAEHPTPKGEFKIMKKEMVRRSLKYNAQMNYALQITNSGIFIHESYNYIENPKEQSSVATIISDTTTSTVSYLRSWLPKTSELKLPIGNINIAGSHGCVRLAHSDAITLYKWAELNTLVIVK